MNMKPVVDAACKDEFRRNPRSHGCLKKYIYIIHLVHVVLIVLVYQVRIHADLRLYIVFRMYSSPNRNGPRYNLGAGVNQRLVQK